jgi:hypothetical protein
MTFSSHLKSKVGNILDKVATLHICESVVLNHFAIKAFCTLPNNNWIQLLFRKVQNALIQLLFLKVQNALIAKWLSTALSQHYAKH